MKKITALLAAAFFVAGTASVVSAADTTSRQTCIYLKAIDQSPVVDDSTILVKLKNNQYKRIDLVSPCLGLKLAGGFDHLTSSGDLCTTDTLHVRDQSGMTCGIRQIVDISPNEANALTARR